MKRFLVLILLSVLLLSACAPKGTFQQVWPTPRATFTPESGVSGPPTPTRLFECIAWRWAPDYLGQSQCVEGGVLRVDKSEEAFLVIFSAEPDSFYGVSFDLDLSDLAGKCVRIVGTIETHKGRPAIIIKSRDQILPCLGKK
ncbi:MAG TPA: hypothetical protein DCP08_08380 [Chloroflexi bacterium]|nr:hypothetical protein [Chloroflexota bacterium]